MFFPMLDTAIVALWSILCVLVGFKLGRQTWIQPQAPEKQVKPEIPMEVPIEDYFDEEREREDGDLSGYEPIGQGKRGE